uniref:Uncharacterized protein n=1 Tax=Arundo donax TaxID=35708 RepID=A0A0A9HD15_ARUDO
MSVEKSRSMYIRLFPELGRLSKEQPPLARFVFLVSSAGPNRRTCVSPGSHSLLLLQSLDAVVIVWGKFSFLMHVSVSTLDSHCYKFDHTLG